MYTQLLFLNLCKISRKLPITESDCNNLAGATFFKSLSIVDTFLQIHQKFKYGFGKQYLRKAAPAAFLQIKIKRFDLRYYATFNF